MKIIQTLHSDFENDTVVTIGTFDGVHIGHQKIIERLVTSAKNNGLKSAILTFFPHPRMVLQKDTKIKMLNTIDEKAKIMEALGLDYLVIKKFTTEFSRITAKDFVSDVLVKHLHAKKVIIGYDHHFGRNRTANIDDLRKFGEKQGFKVEEISAQDINDVSVSSTKIRTALLEGDIKTANSYLGYNYMLNGTVVRGKGLGKNIGFPTANLHIEETYKLIPSEGVYVVKAEISKHIYYGMMNIGINPTVSADNKQSIEINFFNLNESLYGSELQIDMLDRIRNEQKFDSVDALKAQLNQDKLAALQYIKNHETH
ncbi:bifunctional riboflavin kinase/FAD synthetase [Bizionia myxarmorum]|uniref:Riboflavin biosynthesis protein n=1 Tax=Bizionia myxarmorum TaxID=291186 RepID=A0A5D0RA30_9FLAO|nr:bifunctional riboflavin kinase/FAD synthetase [Bizionia myxarmorum]TYB78520.1 bifunctional riboflavin kinase/FAD synthetase [Bizionia myxarmorum]